MSPHPKLFVTGATGHLGAQVIDILLETVSPDAVIAGVREAANDGEAAQALRAKGIETRLADYGRPDQLTSALQGVGRLLLISSSENGQRKQQHRNMIDAAKSAGVDLIAYTSLLRADASPLVLAEEHRDTETALAESGTPFVLLRNGWYNEVFTWRLPLALKTGVLMGATAGGRIASAARADYARAAATVLLGDDHAGKTYELAGDEAFSLSELADIVTAARGSPMIYQDMDPADYQAAVIAAGLPAFVAHILADTDAGIAKGALYDDGRTLSRLIGRPTTPIETTITDFVRRHGDEAREAAQT